MSKAMNFILAAHRGAGRWQRRAVGGAVQEAIKHRMQFAVGDVTECGRLYSWFEGEPLSLYAMAINHGNDSFVKTYEQDCDFAPWLWPGCLCAGYDNRELERLCIARSIWFIRKGEARLWEVSSISRESIGLVLPRTPEDRKRCETCGRSDYSRPAKKCEGRMSLSREQFGALTARFQAYRRAGILEVDGVVAWDVQAVAAGLSRDERAWSGVLLAGRNRGQYGHGVVSSEAVILQGRGITIHGSSVRQARGSRKRRLAAFEREFREGYDSHRYHGSPDLTLDDPIPIAELAREWKHSGSDKIRGFARQIRGRETITARELLSDSQDIFEAARDLAYLLRNWGLAERQAKAVAERAERAAERATLLKTLQAHRDVRVTFADSFAVGNCAPGTIGWLTEMFPEALKGLSLDLPAEKLQKHLAGLKRSLTVGEMLENPKVLESHYARLAIQHAIERSAKVEK